MLRWILGGREALNSVERSPVLCIGEEQPRNCFTELQLLKGHFDIVRFLVQIDDFRCASAGDDGLVLVWNVETGERLQELRGHTQQITAITTFSCRHDACSPSSPPSSPPSPSPSSSSSPSPSPSPSPSLSPPRLITASSDRSLSLWDPDSGNRVQTVSDLQSSVKCVLVLQCVCVWVSGGEELCVWDKDFQLKTNKHNHSDSGITALIELPQNCVAAAMDKDIVIYRLLLSADSASVAELRRLSDHQDQIRALINVTDGLFASGSHAGELVLWDALDWNILAYEHILWEEPAGGVQTEIRLGTPNASEMSIQHLSTNGRLILAAVGGGLYVYSVQTRAVVAYRKEAHHSNVLHTQLLSDSELMSCSEDGSVRMWAIQDLPLPAEPTSPGFFSLWSFGRSSKPSSGVSSSTPNKPVEAPPLRTLELTGDLIGHSGAVQMFVSFGGGALLTCSADHLLIVWRDGERESALRSLELFQRLEERGGL